METIQSSADLVQAFRAAPPRPIPDELHRLAFRQKPRWRAGMLIVCMACAMAFGVFFPWQIGDDIRLDLGATVVPGNAAGSRLYRLIAHLDNPLMPKDGDKLSAAQIEMLRHWIELGAPADAAAAKAQADLNWQVSGELSRKGEEGARLVVVAEDAANAPLYGVEIKALLRHPAQETADVEAFLRADGGGRYIAELDRIPSGNWTLVLEIEQDGKRVFKSENRIFLKD